MYRLRQLERLAFNLTGAAAHALGIAARRLPMLSSDSQPHILIVCSGNICRSPYAEVRLRQVLEERGMAAVEVSSAGVCTKLGLPADDTAIEMSAERGVDLQGHSTTPVSEELLRSASVILIMEPAHARQLKQYRGAAAGKTAYLGAYGASRQVPLIIEDPFGRPPEEFIRCYELIDAALEGLADALAGSTTLPSR